MPAVSCLTGPLMVLLLAALLIPGTAFSQETRESLGCSLVLSHFEKARELGLGENLSLDLADDGGPLGKCGKDKFLRQAAGLAAEMFSAGDLRRLHKLYANETFGRLAQEMAAGRDLPLSQSEMQELRNYFQREIGQELLQRYSVDFGQRLARIVARELKFDRNR